jgi:hypothetical protein
VSSIAIAALPVLTILVVVTLGLVHPSPTAVEVYAKTTWAQLVVAGEAEVCQSDVERVSIDNVTRVRASSRVSRSVPQFAAWRSGDSLVAERVTGKGQIGIGQIVLDPGDRILFSAATSDRDPKPAETPELIISLRRNRESVYTLPLSQQVSLGTSSEAARTIDVSESSSVSAHAANLSTLTIRSRDNRSSVLCGVAEISRASFAEQTPHRSAPSALIEGRVTLPPTTTSHPVPRGGWIELTPGDAPLRLAWAKVADDGAIELSLNGQVERIRIGTGRDALIELSPSLLDTAWSNHTVQTLAVAIGAGVSWITALIQFLKTTRRQKNERARA